METSQANSTALTISNKHFLEHMDKKYKIIFIISGILGIAAIISQIYLISFYHGEFPILLSIITIISLLIYSCINIYAINSISKLKDTAIALKEANLHNQSLTILHDSVRGFKHDFPNIMQGIGGYISTNNMEGLKIYYSQLLKDWNRINNLTALNPKLFNNSAIYNIIATKYYKADNLQTELNLNILIDLGELEKYVNIFEFTRILGILMDNAIEAASECLEKVVNVYFRKEEKRHRFVMIVENTYANKNIDIEKIFQKDFSTKSKKTNSGLGLWEVRQILRKNNNINLYTSKNDNYFSQQIEIYY